MRCREGIREDVPIVVMTLLLLLGAVSIDFFMGGPVIGFVKTCCTIVPWLGSAFGYGTWLMDRCGWRMFELERRQPCASSG